jgi:hypothetical protein
MTQATYEDVQRRYSFVYTTIQRLRDEGVSASVLSDATALQRMKAVGKMINRLTDQWFVPLESLERLSVAPRAPFVHLDNQIPILEVQSLKLADSTGRLTTMAADRYRIDDRYIALTGGRHIVSVEDRIAAFELGGDWGTFPPGTRHVVVDGVFGWVENRPWGQDHGGSVSTTTTIDLAEGDTLVSVEDASFRPRDVIILRSGDAPSSFGARAIVVDTQESPASLIVDPLEIVRGASLPAGSNVVSYGQVPEDVELAAVILVNRMRYGLGSSAFQGEQSRGRIRSEMTDSYQYVLEGRGSTTSTATTTGDPEADRLLSQFTAPPYVGGV